MVGGCRGQMQTNVLLWHVVCVGTRPFGLLGDGMDQRKGRAGSRRVVGGGIGSCKWWGDVEGKCKRTCCCGTSFALAPIRLDCWGTVWTRERDARVVDVSWGVVLGVVRWWKDVEANSK